MHPHMPIVEEHQLGYHGLWELGGELITVVSCFMVIYWQKVLLISIPFSFAHHGWLFVESPLSFTHLVASA
jgi:hypothetical protein